MAKDGTQRGGVRVGAGRKKKALADKILEGKGIEQELSLVPQDIKPVTEIPPPKDYLKDIQADKTTLLSEEIYNETYLWLKNYECEKIVPKELVEHYAQVSGRYIYCEEKLSKYGMLARHPTVPESPIASPFVKMSIDYLKQSSQLWYQIMQLVKENATCAIDTSGVDNTMERLLRHIK